MSKNLLFLFSIFLFGGATYISLEMLWRGFTHISMFFAGGICVLILFLSYTTFALNYPLWAKCLLGSFVITSVEFITGVIVNIALNLKVWDYYSLPLNIGGQVCLYFSFFWLILSVMIVFLSNLIMKFLQT